MLNGTIKFALVTILVSVVVVTGSICPAHALGSVCGVVKYWDLRTDRDEDSYLKSSTFQTNQPARRLKLYLMDKDGLWHDYWEANEGDDDVIAVTYTNSVSGAYCFYNVPGDQDLYLMAKFESDDTEAKDSRDIYNYVASREVHYDWTSGGNRTLNWNITCPDARSQTLQTIAVQITRSQ